MVEAIHKYWLEAKTKFWEYLAWPEEKLSNLNVIRSVYREIDEVKERWANDLISIDSGFAEDADDEIEDVIMEVLDIANNIEMRFGTYKTLLEWAKEHPGEHSDCLDFYFPDKNYTI